MDSAPAMLVSSKEVNQEGAPQARSSHAVAVVRSKAYVFGGESEPRVPIDNLMHVFDLISETWSVAEAGGDIPGARVGVAMASAGTSIFIFGGRDGCHEELNEFYSFDTGTGQWKLLSSGDSGPPHRSYHSLAADEDGQNIYVFGGCGKQGRLNDLWVFSITSERWTSLEFPGACSPRGGPGLAVANGAVWVLFGFDGNELSDVYTFDLITRLWRRVQPDGPEPGAAPVGGRSVFGTATITSCGTEYIMVYGGEVDPSSLGHLGAGAFTDDLLLLDTQNLMWTKPKLHPTVGRHPGPRGWFAAAGFGNSMLVYGGNSPTNDRLDDMFLLTVAGDVKQ